MIIPFQGMVPKIGSRVFVPENALILGDVTLGEDVSIWFNCVIRGDVNWIRIGDRTNIQDMSCIHVTNAKHPTLLGSDCSIAHNVMLHGCTLGNGVLVGMSSTIMDGALIGEGCLVAAGSLVREGFKAPPHSLVAGWPAEVKGSLSDGQKELVASIPDRYLRYKEAYFKDGWPVAQAPDHPQPQAGFAEGHPYP